jgi:RNA polymerase sigma-70 factor (sigma-E family)
VGDRRARDEAEFTAFVVARQAALLRAAYLLTGDGQAAEDLVQTALTETALRWRRLHDTGHPEAYARKVIYTRFVSGWRRRKVVSELSVGDVPDFPVGDHAAVTDTRLMLQRALGSLAPRQRACIVLRYFEDRSEAGTAAVLGCSVGTVKSQTHDALRRLRELAPVLGPTPSEIDSDLPTAEVTP